MDLECRAPLRNHGKKMSCVKEKEVMC